MLKTMTDTNDNESAQLNLNVYHLPSKTIKGHNPEVFKAGRYKPFSYRVAMVHFIHCWAMSDEPLVGNVKQYVRSYVCEFPELAEEVKELRPELLEM